MNVASALEPYRETKDSGVAWLGKIPVGWEIRRNGRLFAQRNETGYPNLPILEVSLRTGVRVRDFNASSRKQVMNDRAKYKRAARGDIAYNMMRMWQGAVGVVPTDGLVSPAYVVARPQPETVPRFFAYLYRTDSYMGEVDNYSRGIVKDRNRLYWEQFKQIPTPYPSPSEQETIVRFLDHVDRRIRRYIRAKQKLIKLLEEQQQAIIRRAVTRGLDPNVRIKPSGVEWLGDVPEHWEVSRVKTEFACLNHRRVPLSGTERGTMTLRRYDYYGASGVIDKVDEYLFDDDLLLIAEDGANLVLRNLPVAIITRGRFWVNNHAHILKPKRGSLEYLAAAMELINYQPWISGAAQPKLTQDRLMGIAIAVAPIEEQRRIVSHVEIETEPLRATIGRARCEIDLLREYRTRLIADVVTGKLDVREAAARLPDEIDELESIDESDVLADAEDATSDDRDAVPEEAEA
ncbi:MAG: restriction endonuclease subunit S [Myxococcota bacterium]|nr:restriction endonuclease subunit S [Myxococcota bacterium]